LFFANEKALKGLEVSSRADQTSHQIGLKVDVEHWNVHCWWKNWLLFCTICWYRWWIKGRNELCWPI